MPELQTTGFQDLLHKLHVVLPEMARNMAFNVDANIAAEGRRDEQRSDANQLQMGMPQRKRGKRYLIRSAWDPKVGWTSTTRMAADGKTRFRMASFSWEVKHRKYAVTAPYTSQLANLWGNETKPYEKQSPIVGQEKMTRVWKRGQKRPAKYNWSRVYSVLAGAVTGAIARTDAKYSAEMGKL